MKVASLQMVSSTVLSENLQVAEQLIAQAADQGAELVVLPEYFCLMGHQDTDKLRIQETFGEYAAGGIQQKLASLARKHQLWIVGGTLPLTTNSPDQVRNSSLVFSPTGECAARYDKIHLFRFNNGKEEYDEARVLEAGNMPTTFELPSKDGHTWRLGLSVCYDLRFPELYRIYASRGADVLLVPAAFTYTTGQAHWELLLRARAVENLAYVIASAQGGHHDNGRRTWGYSMVVCPWGEVLAQREQGAGLVVAELDASQVQKYRHQLPSLQHRVLN